MSLESNISLLVATLDLTMVKSIRSAIRSADAAGGKQFPVTAIGPAPSRPMRFLDADRFDAQRKVHPTPHIEPRKVLHPTPAYAPRPVVNPLPRQELEKLVPAQPEGARATKPFFQPPWRSTPWNNPICSPIEIKRVVHVHDKDHKGQILDLFI